MLISESQLIRPENAVPGDVIILTKPLGTQVAVNLFQWRKKPERWSRVDKVVSVEDAEEAFAMAAESMSRLNLNAARLMHKVRRRLCWRSSLESDEHAVDVVVWSPLCYGRDGLRHPGARA